MGEKEPQAIDLGVRKRRKVMLPGEVFLGNFDTLKERARQDEVWGFSRLLRGVPWVKFEPTAETKIDQVTRSGHYESVRTIPAYDRLGKTIGSAVGIVATPTLTPPR